MAQSRLDPTLRYLEPPAASGSVIHPSDAGHKSGVYLMHLPLTGLDYRALVGRICYDARASHRIAFVRIYLLPARGDVAVRWIGVFEMYDTEVVDVVVDAAAIGGHEHKKAKYDKRGPYNLAGRKPLLFESVTSEYLHSVVPNGYTSDAAAAASAAAAPLRAPPPPRVLDAPMAPTAPTAPAPKKNVVAPLSRTTTTTTGTTAKLDRHNLFDTTETTGDYAAPAPASASLASLRALADRDRAAYTPAPTDNWVRAFMRSKSYEIHPVPGDGDCLFHAVVAAYAGAGMVTTVAKLRQLVAQEATSAVLEEHHALYTSVYDQVMVETRQSTALRAAYSEHTARMKAPDSGLSRAQRAEVYAEALRIKAEYDAIAAQVAKSKKLLREFEHMRNVTTLDEFRAFVRTREFWADAWVINLLERVLRLKMVILKRIRDGDENDVLQCGYAADADREPPLHYLVLDYEGDMHYQLISADRRTLFTFAQLPMGLKMLVVDKCLERIGVGYAAIPEFRQLQDELSSSGTSSASSSSSSFAAAAAAAAAASTTAAIVDEASLFSPNVLFRIYSGSADTEPGKTTGERLPARLRPRFAALEKHEHWRRKLDNAWAEAPFWVPGADDGGLRWASVVHYLAAAPLRRTNEAAYRALSLDVGTPLAQDPKLAIKAITGVAASEKRKAVAGLYQQDYERGLAQVDMDALLMAALRAKFDQNVDLRTVLLLTHDAQIHVVARGKEPVNDVHLMRVRAELRAAQQPTVDGGAKA